MAILCLVLQQVNIFSQILICSEPVITVVSTIALHHLHFSPTVISANEIHVVSFEQTSCYLQMNLHSI